MTTDLIYREKVLKDLAETIERRLTEAYGERMQFTLMITDTEIGSYLTNTPRAMRIQAAQTMLENWKAPQ